MKLEIESDIKNKEISDNNIIMENIISNMELDLLISIYNLNDKYYSLSCNDDKNIISKLIENKLIEYVGKGFNLLKLSQKGINLIEKEIKRRK
jgi:hypothetical protein